jgi:hypothetical protein
MDIVLFLLLLLLFHISPQAELRWQEILDLLKTLPLCQELIFID